MSTSKFAHPLRYPSLDPDTKPEDALEQISITVSALERNRRALEDWLNAYVLAIDEATGDVPLPTGVTEITIGGSALGKVHTVLIAAVDASVPPPAK